MTGSEYSVEAAADLTGALRRFLQRPSIAPELAREQIASIEAFIGASRSGWSVFPPASAAPPDVLSLLLPGRTALLMLAPATDDDARQSLRASLRSAVEDCERRALHYAQALTEVGDAAAASALVDTGFRRIATLIYLEATSAAVRRRPPRGAAWRTVDALDEAAIHGLLESTYAGSADCPELNGLRPLPDVLASHRASGPYAPTLWEVLESDGRLVGCVWLSVVARTDALELVYMGVRHDCRRRGLGASLLSRAFELMRRHGAARITLAVDERNSAARRLYQRFGFDEVARREAFLRRCGGAPRAAR